MAKARQVLTIKREKWLVRYELRKIGKKRIAQPISKYYVVAREKGSVTARVKWSRKNNVEKLTRLYRQNGTFDRKRRTTTSSSWKTKEYIDYNKKPRFYSDVLSYQAVAEAHLKSGEVVVGRSLQHSMDYPISKARAEALENMYFLIAQHYKEQYSAEIGKEIFKRDRRAIHLKEGVVYYRNKRLSKSSMSD
jgi:hypothetical protein